MDGQLLPLYLHLVDGYSEKLREEWFVKGEEADIEATPLVKEEPLYDNLGEPPDNLKETPDDYSVETYQVNKSASQFKVIII